MTSVSLRSARLDDAQLLFEWRNRPEIAALGTQQRMVTWDEHLEWFSRAIGSDEILLFVVEGNGMPIGQVRFEADGEGRWRVSIYLLEPHTGHGVGVEALRLGCIEAEARAAREIVAYVRNGNERSVRAFEKAGFLPAEGAPAGHAALRLESRAS